MFDPDEKTNKNWMRHLCKSPYVQRLCFSICAFHIIAYVLFQLEFSFNVTRTLNSVLMRKNISITTSAEPLFELYDVAPDNSSTTILQLEETALMYPYFENLALFSTFSATNRTWALFSHFFAFYTAHGYKSL